VNIAALIQEAKNVASRLESPADLFNIGEQVMREIPNTLLAYIPSTVMTGKVSSDIQDAVRKTFGIELTAAETNDLQRGTIPTRVRVAIQTRIPVMLRTIQSIERYLKNFGMGIEVLSMIIIPTVHPYLNKDLQKAVAQSIEFARDNEAALQEIAIKLLAYTGMLKDGLTRLQNSGDIQFKNKLVEAVTTIQNQAIPLFNTIIKPFIMQNQGQVFNRLLLFKGVRFSNADAQRIKNAVRTVAQQLS